MFDKTDLINLIENYTITILEFTFTFERDVKSLKIITNPILDNDFYIDVTDIQNIKFIIYDIKIQLNITNYEEIIKNVFLICYIINIIFNYSDYKFHFVYIDNMYILKLDNFERSVYAFDNKIITINIINMRITYTYTIDSQIETQFIGILNLDNYNKMIKTCIQFLFIK